MPSKDINNIIIPAKKRGRPSKADLTKRALVQATADAVASAENSVKAAAAKAAKANGEEKVVKPFDTSNYSGVFSGALKRSKDSELTVIGRRKVSYKGKKYDFVDIRLFYFDFNKDKWFPTSKGATFKVEDAPAFISAIAEAVASSVS